MADDGTLSESMINKASAYIDKYEKEGVKDATEKGKAMYLAEQYYDTIDTLNKNSESFRADANLFAVFGRNGGSVERLVNVEKALLAHIDEGKVSPPPTKLIR